MSQKNKIKIKIQEQNKRHHWAWIIMILFSCLVICAEMCIDGILSGVHRKGKIKMRLLVVAFMKLIKIGGF